MIKVVNIFAITINEHINECIYNKLMSLISHEKNERIKRYRFLDDIKRTLYGDILIRYLICKANKMKNDEIIINRNKFGKPFIKDLTDFHFNISHSGEWVVCATNNKEVGIDVERIKNIDLNIAKRHFSEFEYKSLMKQRNKIDYFYELWTLKESYIKYIGTGLQLPLNSFSIKIKNDLAILEPYSKNIYFKRYQLKGKYKLSVCTKKSRFAENIRYYSIKDILESNILY